MGKDTFNAALDSGGNQFYGLLGDVAVFNTALSATRIKDLAQAKHLSRTEQGLLAGFVFGYPVSEGSKPFHLHFAVTNLGEERKDSGGTFRTIPAPFCNYEYSEDQGKTWKHVIRGIPLQGQWVRRAVTQSPVRFSAVWRPNMGGEIQVYGWEYADLRAKYDGLWNYGWRLTHISPYVQ